MRLLRNYAESYNENAGKYANIIDLNMKIKNHQKTLYLERETLLLKELKSLVFSLKITIIFVLIESQDEVKEYKELYEKAMEQLNSMNSFYHKAVESVGKFTER